MKRVYYAPAALISCILLLQGCAQPLAQQSGSNLIGSLALSAKSSSKPEPNDACYATAEELAKSGHDREAILLLEKVKRLTPKQDVSAELAVLYARNGNASKAGREFELALQANPKDAELLSNYGYFQLQVGNLTESERLLVRSTEIAPANKQAQMNYALLLAHQGKISESLKRFEAIVGKAAAHSNVGVILARNDQQAEAIKHLALARDLDPQLPQASAFLAELKEQP